MLPVQMEGMRDLLDVLGQPVMMRSARARISESFTKACWKASLQSGMMRA